MRFYSGIDLHSNNSVVSVINEEGLTVFQKRLNNDIETIKLVLLPYKTALIGIVVESTYNWYWLVDGLQHAGFVVHLANMGHRMLAIAVKSVNPEHTVLEHDDVEGSLTLLGMVGMIDPPRSEVIAAVAECYGAGISVKMITGDHAKTAIAIAHQIGLKNADNVLTGVDLDAMDDYSLQQVAQECNIFARTSPEHKLRLVMALQSHGLVVAMTGDGVNDAPALKRPF